MSVASQRVMAVVRAQTKAAEDMEEEECTDMRDIWGWGKGTGLAILDYSIVLCPTAKP